MLFFYMVVLSVIFILQFSIACSCLAVGEEKEIEYAHTVVMLLTTGFVLFENAVALHFVPFHFVPGHFSRSFRPLIHFVPGNFVP
jgi:hypothetical protein